jgi:hypothetical protein
LASLSFGFIDDFLWKEFKKPISNLDAWTHRLELAKAHIGFLKRVQALCYPNDKVFLRYDEFFGEYKGETSMRYIINKYNFLIEKLSLVEGGKIDRFAFEDIFRRIQTLSNLKGKYIIGQIDPLIHLFMLYANHLIRTPNDEDFLIAMHPKMLSLCVISYFKSVDFFLFDDFRLSTFSLITKAVKFILKWPIPDKAPSMVDSMEQKQWQDKIYSRIKYLKRVNKEIHLGETL